MKLSILLALSLLPLCCEEKHSLAVSGITLDELSRKGVPVSRVKRMLQFLQEEKLVHVTFWGMKNYPAILYQMEKPPYRLFYTGTLPAGHNRLLTLCGTRYPNGNGAQRAYRFALETCANQTSIVTSNSRGIDRSALYASRDMGTCAYVICDCGLAMSRIKAYRSMQSISLISPYEPDDAAFPSRCLSRNMLSTALGSATMVIQAPLKSGSLHCAGSALDQGREVFVHREGIKGGQVDEGTHLLYSSGAQDVASYGELAAIMHWEHRMHVQERQGGGSSLYRFGPAWYSLEYA